LLTKLENSGRAALCELLDAAIEHGHIWPAFQPIIDISSGALVGFEVLARWSDPSHGDISPAAFIPALEKHDIIDKLFNHLVKLACPVAADWPGRFFLAFNLSPKQLIRPNLPAEIAEVVGTTGFPCSRFQVEVTEGSLISDNDRAYANLRELDAMGIKVAIDDFGTGYSSLARLEAFPFRKLKIDRRFVSSLDRDTSKRRIAAAIIGLGHSLGITVVAEGVETDQEEAVLRDLGCNLGQGWLYGKPEPKHLARLALEAFGVADLEMIRPLDASPFQQLHQLATLYRQAPVGLCFLDLDYRHVRANDRFASIHNMTGAELEGKTISDLMSGSTLAAVKRVLLQSVSSDEPVPENYVVGDRHIGVVCTRVVDSAGEVIGFSVVAVDTPNPSDRCKRLMEVGVTFGKKPPLLRTCAACGQNSELH
jgi:PAS domain S-box-containing protein